jgi:hypothetical protein
MAVHDLARHLDHGQRAAPQQLDLEFAHGQWLSIGRQDMSGVEAELDPATPASPWQAQPPDVGLEDGAQRRCRAIGQERGERTA